MLIAVLPLGYAFDDSYHTVTFAVQWTSPGPLPTRFKVFGGRMAMFWDLEENREDVTWKMRKVQTSELVSLVADLNQRALQHRRQNVTVSLKDEGQHEEEERVSSTGDSEGPESATGSAPKPEGAAGWLLEAARRVPVLNYAIGVVGLVAAAVVSVGFFLGHWEYALFGGLAVFVGMVLVRLYATSQPENIKINPSVPIQMLIWVCVAAFAILVAMGIVKLALNLFTSSRAPADTKQTNDSKAGPGANGLALLPPLAKVDNEFRDLMQYRSKTDLKSRGRCSQREQAHTCGSISPEVSTITKKITSATSDPFRTSPAPPFLA
jgi:hypothetical protein